MRNINYRHEKNIYFIGRNRPKRTRHPEGTLVQFENPHIKFTVFPKVESKTKILKILGQAKADNALVAFTLVKKATEIDQRVLHQKQHLSCRHPRSLINNISSYLKIEPWKTRDCCERLMSAISSESRRSSLLSIMTTARGHSVWRKPILSSSVSQGHRRPQHLFSCTTGVQGCQCADRPGIPLPDEVFKIDQCKISCLIMDRMCSRKCDLPAWPLYNRQQLHRP